MIAGTIFVVDPDGWPLIVVTMLPKEMKDYHLSMAQGGRA